MELRIGQGYDIHALKEGRRLILGGVEITHTRGLDGHSDADVLLHAIMDALLGAANLGDIGRHFPPSDEQWRGISSLLLLESVARLVQAEGWRVVNIDATVIAEKPRIGPHVPTMQERIAQHLAISPEVIAIKATTNERLGALGREEGIAALAVALLMRD